MPNVRIRQTPDELDVEAVLAGQMDPARVRQIDRAAVALRLIQRPDRPSSREIARIAGMSRRNVHRISAGARPHGL